MRRTAEPRAGSCDGVQSAWNKDTPHNPQPTIPPRTTTTPRLLTTETRNQQPTTKMAGPSFETFSDVFATLCRTALFDGFLPACFQPSHLPRKPTRTHVGRDQIHAMCILCGERAVSATNPRITRLAEPFRANLCNHCRRGSDSQPRWSDTTQGSSTHSTCQVVIDSTQLQAMRSTKRASDMFSLLFGLGLGSVATSMCMPNGRQHMIVHLDAAGNQWCHVLGYAGKMDLRNIARKMDANVHLISVIDRNSGGLQNYAITRDKAGVPLAEACV